MIEMYFIRHGATAGNQERRYIGRTDEPLSPEGLNQLEELKKLTLQPDRLYVSPMLRTRETAEILFPGMEAVLVEDFRETDFGVFEGRTAAEMMHDPQYQAWLDTMCLGPVPGGERVEAFKDRCCEAFLDLALSLPDGISVAFVIHGGVIMSILERMAEPRRDFYEYHIRNGECVHCFYEKGVITLAADLDGN